jgi:hypothetical protein
MRSHICNTYLVGGSVQKRLSSIFRLIVRLPLRGEFPGENLQDLLAFIAIAQVFLLFVARLSTAAQGFGL